MWNILTRAYNAFLHMTFILFLIVTRCADRWYNSAFIQGIYYFINFVYGLEENDVISSKRQSRLPQVWGRKIKKHCGSGHERLIIYTVEITRAVRRRNFENYASRVRKVCAI